MTTKIVPHQTAAYSFRQSRFYPKVPEAPVRGIIVAPSGGGKSTFLVDLLIRIYRGVYNRIYVFSPNAQHDVADIWRPVEEYCRSALKQEEPCLYEDWDEGRIMELIDKHKRITRLCREAKRTELFQSCFVFDDWADEEHLQKNSPAIKYLFVKGRHCGASVWMSVQKYRTLGNIVRVNATSLIVFKLRSRAELEAIAEENSALYGTKVTEAIIQKATEEKYSFLWLNLTASDPKDLFWLRFESRLVPRAQK